MAKTWSSAYDFFADYFKLGMNVDKSLRLYGLYPEGKYNPGSVSSKFRNMKVKYKEDYEQAKRDFMDCYGINETNLFRLTYEIALHSDSDSNKLRAIDLLDRLLKTSSDSGLINNANKLIIEVVPKRTPSDEMNDEL